MNPSPSTQPDKRRDLTPLLLFGLCLLVYGNTAWNQLLFEDRTLTTGNPEFAKGIYLGELFHPGYFLYAQARAYRPVATATYLLDYALWGRNPAGYHLSSVAVHFLAAWGLYVFIALLFRKKFPALAAGVLFALHPAGAEAVCGVAYRADLLAAGFGFWALAAYVRGRGLAIDTRDEQKERPAGRGLWVALSLALFLLALFSKESALGLPVLAVLIEVAAGSFPRRIRQAALPLLGLSLVVAFYAYVRFHLLVSPEEIPAQFQGWNRQVALFTGLVTVLRYVQLLVLPVQLSVGWGAEPIPSLFQSVALLGLVFWMVLIGLVVWSLRKAPSYFVAGALFIVGLLPVVGGWPLEQPVAERYLYLPVAGFGLAVALLIGNKVPRSVRILVLVILSFLYGARTLARTFDWRDELSLWRSAQQVAPDSAAVQSRLAVALWRTGLRTEAERTLRQALKADPEEFEARFWFGLFCLEQGMGDSAASHLRKAVELRPNHANARLALGQTLEALGQASEAEQQYLRMLERNPRDPQALYRLAALKHQRGDRTAADFYCRQVLQVKPDQKEALVLLAQIYGEGRHYSQAAQILEQVVQLDPEATTSLFNLAYSYRQLGEQGKARQVFQRLLAREPNNARLWLEKADNERLAGDLEQALADARRALELQAGYEEAERFLEMFTPSEAPAAIPSATTVPEATGGLEDVEVDRGRSLEDGSENRSLE